MSRAPAGGRRRRPDPVAAGEVDGVGSESSSGSCGGIMRLIVRATESTSPELDPHLLRAIKSAARGSDDEVRISVATLMGQMRKPHAQIRYLATLIVDELFTRSKLFRSLFVLDLDKFLALSVGYQASAPLPPPNNVAVTLRKKSIEHLEKWHHMFGIHYPQLRIGYDYLKNTLHLQFPGLPETAARLELERQERAARTQEILTTKFEHMKANFDSIKADIRSTIDEIEHCLEIFSARQEQFDFGDSDEEEFGSLEMRRIRIEAIKAGKQVHETGENSIVFDTLRELQKLLISKHLVAVQDWISVLIRVDAADNRFRDAALKDFISLKNAIKSVESRCSELGLVPDGRDKQKAVEMEEEDLWEEGKVGASGSSSKESADDTPSTTTVKQLVSFTSTQKSSRSRVEVDPRKRELLKDAPVVTWGPVLEQWGSERDAPINQRGLELEGHWGRVDYDAVIPAEKIAELSMHRSVYKETPTEIKPCLAPLKKGGLCQRRDLKVCPFHGPIIPRDAAGDPIKQDRVDNDDLIDGVLPAAADPDGAIAPETNEDAAANGGIRKETAELLARQAIENVREQDRDAKALKRAKRAKIRAHNEEVLREAAIASTSYSHHSGTDTTVPQQGRNGAKRKKPTLASMLKKKVTVKDRLSQRLLNSRTSDAAIKEITEGEDSKYREAFPNQW